jgi:hypothetical protein
VSLPGCLSRVIVDWQSGDWEGGHFEFWDGNALSSVPALWGKLIHPHGFCTLEYRNGELKLSFASHNAVTHFDYSFEPIRHRETVNSTAKLHPTTYLHLPWFHTSPEFYGSERMSLKIRDLGVALTTQPAA